VMLSIDLSHIAFIMLRYNTSFPSFIRAFISFYSDDHVFFFLCFCHYVALHLVICICWTIPASLGWNQHHGVWYFWYAVEFSLLIFYWRFLHPCSLKRLASNSLYPLLCNYSVWGWV
jgi:hypothetical protein